MVRHRWWPTVKGSGGKGGRKRQQSWPDIGYSPKPIRNYRGKKKMEGFFATDKDLFGDPQRRGPGGRLRRGGTRGDRKGRKMETRGERPSTPSVKRWWSQCLDRSAVEASSGFFYLVGWKWWAGGRRWFG